MNDWLIWLVLLTALLMMLGSGAIVWVVLRSWKQQTDSLQPVLLRQLELVDKLSTLASVKDLEAYQGVVGIDRAVKDYDDPYNPSDEALAQAEAARDGYSLEVMRGEDEDALRGLFT